MKAITYLIWAKTSKLVAYPLMQMAFVNLIEMAHNFNSNWVSEIVIIKWINKDSILLFSSTIVKGKLGSLLESKMFCHHNDETSWLPIKVVIFVR